MRGAGVLLPGVRARGLDQWLPTYLTERERRQRPVDGELHLLLCIADHFEPGNGGVPEPVARGRVAAWEREYPRALGGFTDSDGRPPRHTFFYPMEQYVEADLDSLARLCRAGFGEVEIHLHHDRDTSANLRTRLVESKRVLSGRHGLLARDRTSGAVKYGFVHGDWALGNSLPGGSCCGVDDELAVLAETGCYADFTLPAAPSAAQTRKINSIYRAGHASRRGHDHGVDLGSGAGTGLLLIQGPLVLSGRRKKWGVLPRVENGCVQANQRLDVERIDDWLRARVQVASRPDWFFVKLHTHGAPEANAATLVGETGVRFHRELAERAADRCFHYHYVTAREMYNLARAAEAGWGGGVCEALDFELEWNGKLGGAE